MLTTMKIGWLSFLCGFWFGAAEAANMIAVWYIKLGGWCIKQGKQCNVEYGAAVEQWITEAQRKAQ
jgi:hypothetical protein